MGTFGMLCLMNSRRRRRRSWVDIAGEERCYVTKVCMYYYCDDLLYPETNRKRGVKIV